MSQLALTIDPAPSSLPSYARTDLEGIRMALHRDGFAFIPGVLDAEKVARTRSEIDALRPFGFDTQNDRVDHYKCVFNRSLFWLDYLDPPGIIDAVEDGMGPDCHLVGMSAWRTHPGAGDRYIHTDNIFVPLPEVVFEDPGFQLPILLGTVHYYLSDIDETLCPTYVIPGSHRSGRAPRADDEGRWRGREPIPVLCRAGDALIFRCELWHGGSKNQTPDRTRYLLQAHYSHRTISQHFSPFLTWQFNQEVLAQATPRQRRLLGEHRRMAYD